jgi:hypothetical protein
LRASFSLPIAKIKTNFLEYRAVPKKEQLYSIATKKSKCDPQVVFVVFSNKAKADKIGAKEPKAKRICMSTNYLKMI